MRASAVWRVSAHDAAMTQGAGYMIDPQWQLGEGYELLATYPAGAGGAIWLVRVQEDGSERAIKILRPELTTVAEVVDGFCALLDSVRQLAHPGILVAEETVVHGNRVALVMRRMPGEDLRALLDRQQAPTSASAVALMAAELCDALAVAHAAGIVHGDVKPSNVLMDPDPGTGVPRAVRLTDFGLAALAARSGVAVLPAEYRAPETGVGGQSLTPAADVYAVGIVLYEALAGRPPFTGTQPDGIGRMHREVLPPRVPAIPDGLWPVVAACLEKNPRERPTAALLADLLREIAPTILALPASATDNTVQIARIPAAPAPRPVTLTSVVPVVPVKPAVPAAAAPVEASEAESPPARRRPVLSGPRGIALAVASGAVVFFVALALINGSGDSPSGSLAAGTSTSSALALGGPSAEFTSTVTTTLTPTASNGASASATASPSPDADSTSGSATPSPSASTTSSNASVNGSASTTAVASATPSAGGGSATANAGTVTVQWQCSTNEANPSGIRKTACIGIGSDGGLYIQGTFTASDGQTINDVKVSLAEYGQYVETTSESCDASSCSITGGPYDPSAGTYQAYAGSDGSAHNEVSPKIEYQGG
jgi:serine/threonine-protein kinase